MDLLSSYPSISSHPSISPLKSSKPTRVSSPLLVFFTSPPILLPHSPICSFPPFTPSFLTKPISINTSKKSPGAALQQQKYVYPDPIPEFAEAETQKFKVELLNKLSKNKETFGNETDAVVKVCAEIFSDFLHKEYGGPGTLLVEPFTDMLLALKEKKLPGAPIAARAALLWAQNYVDRDWEIWTSQLPK